MFLGFDIGTSAVKAVLMAPNGEVLADASAPLELVSPQPGWNEQNPDDWWRATLDAASALQKQVPEAWQQVSGIGLSGQMHGAVLLGEDKKPLRPAILWNDGRSAPQCEMLANEMPNIGDIAGVIPMPGFTAPKLRWVSENEPDVHSQIKHILLPKDYVRLKLADVLAIDMADAAGTMWLDQKTRKWSNELCAVSATDPKWLPVLFEGTAVSGTLTQEAAELLNLKPGIVIAAGAGDAAAGAMGIGAVNDGDSFISLGTSGQLFVVTDRYSPSPQSATHAYAHCVPGRWFLMAAMLNGASPMSWFAGVATEDIGTLLKEAEAEDASRIPLYLPYLTGERTPHNDAKIRSCFYGMDPLTNRAQMMRAVVDAIAYTFCDARDAMVQAGAKIDNPAAIGGGSQSDFVLQNMADAMGISITRYADAETGPALGAARLAAIAAGATNLNEVSQVPETDRVFTPNPLKAEYHKTRLQSYRDLYQALKPFAAGQ